MSQVAVSSTAAPVAGWNRAAILSGIGVGIVQAATPLVFWWLDSAIVYALGLAVIAAIYVGFAVADGRVEDHRRREQRGLHLRGRGRRRDHRTPWLLVVGFVGHGLKDLWQHRTHFVTNTRWWPPFCMAVDFVVAAVIVVEIAAGLHFR